MAEVIGTIAFDGIELPELLPSSVLQRRSDIYKACQQEAATITRYVRLGGHLIDFSLPEVLDITETVFKSVADQVEAKIPAHSWGLARAPQDPSASRSYAYRHPILPEGYALVATVDVVEEWRPLAYLDRVMLEQRLGHLEGTPIQSGIASWQDASPEQFVKNSAGIHLVDLEPLIHIEDS